MVAHSYELERLIGIQIDCLSIVEERVVVDQVRFELERPGRRSQWSFGTP